MPAEDASDGGPPLDQWAKERWQGNPAASDDEKRAVGYVEPPPPGTPPVPAIDPDPRAAFRP